VMRSIPLPSHSRRRLTLGHSIGSPPTLARSRSARATRIWIGQTVAVRSDLWRVIHAERAALVDDLAGLDPAQWATPSLCDGWDVHDVVAHLAATATLSLLGFAKEFLLAGFSSGRIVDKQVAAGRRRKPSETLSALRSAIFSAASPPQPAITRIIEIIVHGEDIRRPLHIGHDYSTVHIAEALDYLARDGSSGAKAHLAGLRLHAVLLCLSYPGRANKHSMNGFGRQRRRDGGGCPKASVPATAWPRTSEPAGDGSQSVGLDCAHWFEHDDFCESHRQRR
jgi:uncharacterized protein (TIGR03083 family)